MKFEIEFHKLAMKEYVDAYNWYEDKRIGLGEKFIVEVRKQLEVVADKPYQFSIKRKSYREARVGIFPYNIVYQIIKTDGLIYVAAIYHGKRNPNKKFRKRK